MYDALDSFNLLLPEEPMFIPPRYYVYQLYIWKYGPAYIGKGKGSRAWQHIDNLRLIMKSRLLGKQHSAETAVYIGILHHMIKYNRKIEVVIMQSDLTEKRAFDLESKFIDKYGRIIDGTGTLFNLADGGPSIGKKYYAIKSCHESGVNVSGRNYRSRKKPGKRARTHCQNAL